jgi:hypothetical protein
VHATPQDCLKSCIEEPNIDNRDREKGSTATGPFLLHDDDKAEAGKKKT